MEIEERQAAPLRQGEDEKRDDERIKIRKTREYREKTREEQDGGKTREKTREKMRGTMKNQRIW